MLHSWFCSWTHQLMVMVSQETLPSPPALCIVSYIKVGMRGDGLYKTRILTILVLYSGESLLQRLSLNFLFTELTGLFFKNMNGTFWLSESMKWYLKVSNVNGSEPSFLISGTQSHQEGGRTTFTLFKTLYSCHFPTPRKSLHH